MKCIYMIPPQTHIPYAYTDNVSMDCLMFALQKRDVLPVECVGRVQKII